MNTKYNIQNQAKFCYYKCPKILFHGEKYREQLNNNDIVAYMLLMDRLNVSVKNNWIDNDGNIYFIYTNKKLAEILKLSERVVIKIKNNLKNIGLLSEEKTGRASRLYLHEPETVSVEESKFIIELDQQVYSDDSKFSDETKERMAEAQKGNSNAKKDKKPENCTNNQENDEYNLKTIELTKSQFYGFSAQPRGFEENQKRKNLPLISSELTKSQPSNNNLVIDKDIKDIKDQNIIEKSFDNKNLDSELIENYILENDLLNQYGEKLITVLKKYSFSNFKTFEIYIKQLHFAKDKIEKENQQNIYPYFENEVGEFIESELISAFNRCLFKYKQGKVRNIASYLFIAFKQVYQDYVNSLNIESVDLEFLQK